MILESHWIPNASMDYSLMLQVKMDGGLIGQDDGSLTIGLQYKAKQVLPGRSSVLLPLPFTHGALSGSVEKS